MSVKKLREKKKKSRERKAKQKVQERRSALRKQTSKENKIAKAERVGRERLTPYVKPVEQDPQKDKQIMEQLKRNAEILKALEEEYNKTQESRKALHDDLEEEGHVTLKEKLNALEEKKNEELNINEEYKYNELIEEK